jgi:hypothetical protein
MFVVKPSAPYPNKSMDLADLSYLVTYTANHKHMISGLKRRVRELKSTNRRV